MAVAGGLKYQPGEQQMESDDPKILTGTVRGLIAAPMIDTATILIARRRRTIAVRAEICV